MGGENGCSMTKSNYGKTFCVCKTIGMWLNVGRRLSLCYDILTSTLFFWLGHNDTPKLVFEALYKCKICETYQFKCGKMLANRMCQWLSLQAIPREQICTQWKNTIRSRNWKYKLIINKYITCHITTWTHMYNKKINKKTSTYEKTEFRLIKGGLALIGWMCALSQSNIRHFSTYGTSCITPCTLCIGLITFCISSNSLINAHLKLNIIIWIRIPSHLHESNINN